MVVIVCRSLMCVQIFVTFSLLVIDVKTKPGFEMDVEAYPLGVASVNVVAGDIAQDCAMIAQELHGLTAAGCLERR